MYEDAGDGLTVIGLGENVRCRMHVFTTGGCQQDNDDDQRHTDVDKDETLSKESEISGFQGATPVEISPCLIADRSERHT